MTYRVLTLAAANLGLAGVYLCAGLLGLRLALGHPSASAVWPPTGLALAATLAFGSRLAPGVFLGAFLVNLSTPGTLVTATGIAAGNTLEALLGAGLLKYVVGDLRLLFQNTRGALAYILLTALLAPMVSATLGVGTLMLSGYAESSNAALIWLTWWLGDASSALLIPPLLYAWRDRGSPSWTRSRALEGAALLVSLVAVSLVIFGGWFPGATKTYPLTFLTLPFLVWAASRFHPQGASTAVFVLTIVAIQGTLRGYGPYSVSDPEVGLVLLQGFIATLATTALVVSALVSERARAQAAVRDLNATLERRVEERTAELQEALRELEGLSYTLAHDLRSPLRAMTGFSEILADQFAPALGGAGRDYTRRIVQGARRMDILIRDLLAYGRLTREELVLEDVDPEAVLAEVLGDLAAEIRERRAQVDVLGPLPRLRGHRGMFAQAASNLISNAIKFVPPGVEPRVTIRAERRMSRVRLWVEDNGIGIDPRYHAVIFGIFQRLHTATAYAGTGIGLAIVRKVMERMGGAVGVVSEPGRGSRFWIELPEAPAARADRNVA
jgi:signal transduction histidine kinase